MANIVSRLGDFMGKIVSHTLDGTIITKIGQETIERWYSISEDNVFEKQQRLLRHMLSYAKKHCSFYKNIEANLDERDVSTFPLVEKKVISPRFEEFCSDIRKWFTYSHGYTGGSTGEPFHMLRCGGYESVFGLRKWAHYGYQTGDLIMGMGGDKFDDNTIFMSRHVFKKNSTDIPFGSLGMSSLYLTENNAKDYCLDIQAIRPAFLRGYPSFIYALACYAEQYGIELGEGMKGIELTSESAFAYQIEKMKAVYHCPVHLQYGHTEAIVFGYTFDDSLRYRVEPLYGFVEVLDEHNQHVGVNEVGEVVVTTLHNYAMPLIRYRTGDYAEYGGKDYRFVYLNKVMGRTQDYVINKNGDKVLLTALIFGQHCKAMGNIIKWQLEQYEPGEIQVHIVRGERFSEKDEKELQRLFAELGNVEPEFDYVQDIPPTPRGKSKMLIQHLN